VVVIVVIVGVVGVLLVRLDTFVVVFGIARVGCCVAIVGVCVCVVVAGVADDDVVVGCVYRGYFVADGSTIVYEFVIICVIVVVYIDVIYVVFIIVFVLAADVGVGVGVVTVVGVVARVVPVLLLTLCTRMMMVYWLCCYF